jgi:hypothetical protein
MAMAKKFGKRRDTLEDKLRAILELTGWQAELARAALKQVGETARKGRAGPDARGKSGPQP